MDKLEKSALVLSLVENAKLKGSWCGILIPTEY